MMKLNPPNKVMRRIIDYCCGWREPKPLGEVVFPKSKKNCPHCDSTPAEHHVIPCVSEAMTTRQVECKACGARGPVEVSATEAVTAWRKRS